MSVRSPRVRAWRAFAGRLRVRLLRLVEHLEIVMQRRRSRLALLELTDEQLKDIGLSRADAEGEARRSFWL